MAVGVPYVSVLCNRFELNRHVESRIHSDTPLDLAMCHVIWLQNNAFMLP
jgi:hypothetical protein